MKQHDPNIQDPQVLIARYKGRIKLAGVAKVYDVMKANNVTVEDIQEYVASKDPNRSPLEKVRELKKAQRNGNPQQTSDKQPVHGQLSTTGPGSKPNPSKTTYTPKGTKQTV